jgi:cation transport regulator ChaB
MPFDPSHPPAKLKKLSPKKRRQWVRVFNSEYDRSHDDRKAHMVAWGAVKKSDVIDQLEGFNGFVVWKEQESSAGGQNEKETLKN